MKKGKVVCVKHFGIKERFLNNDENLVYIGRPNVQFPGNHPFGNPIVLKRGEAKGSTLQKYETYLVDRLKTMIISEKK